jgi:predicted ABC-type ATPase
MCVKISLITLWSVEMGIQTTKDRYFNGREYRLIRKSLHRKIVAKFIEERGARLENDLEAILLGGGSGSGKSFIVNEIIGTEGFVIIDSDKIKEELMEYRVLIKKKNVLAADIVHDESSDIANMLLKATIEIPDSFIYDGTMKNREKYKGIIEELRNKGYKIYMVVVDVDVEVALGRAQLRYEGDGRFVSEKTVRETNMLVAASFLELVDLVDSYTVFENSVTGIEPKIIAKKDINQPIEIFDDKAFERFTKKSDLMIM